MENSIGLEGTKAIADMLKENCYITDLVCCNLFFLPSFFSPAPDIVLNSIVMISYVFGDISFLLFRRVILN